MEDRYRQDSLGSGWHPHPSSISTPDNSGSQSSGFSEIFPIIGGAGTNQLQLAGGLEVSYGAATALGPVLTLDNFVLDEATAKISGTVNGDGPAIQNVVIADISPTGYLTTDPQLTTLLQNIFNVPVAPQTAIGPLTITPEPAAGILEALGVAFMAIVTAIVRRNSSKFTE